MAFTRKVIEVDFSLAQGVFAGGGNTHNVSGMRVSANIVKAGGASFGDALLAIYGLPLSTMNALSTFGNAIILTGRNRITVKAGEEGGVLTTVFEGTIKTAYMDGQAQPNVPFRVEANVVAFEIVQPIPPTSMPGTQKIADLMESVAKTMGLGFENNGVMASITNPYFANTGPSQILQMAEAAGIEHIIDNGTLAIWPARGQRQGDGATISPTTGLVGYPRFNSMGIELVTLWQPSLEYGKTINVESSITPACGKWVIYRLEYDLESETPNGKWFCTLMASKPGQMVL